jgi:hypothetical protein
MKNGAVAKSDAFDVADNTVVCGIMAINWNGNNWANACDFRGGDFTNAKVSIFLTFFKQLLVLKRYGSVMCSLP